MTPLTKTSDYFYDLPTELIAQEPMEPRDHSRLLLMDKQSGELQDKRFFDIADYLESGDTLILNDSRVLPARIYGKRQISGSTVELLLLHTAGNDEWEVLAGPGRHAKVGDTLIFGDGKLTAQVLDIVNEGNRLVKFSYEGNFYNILEEIGQMPLPPYITKKLENQERYQRSARPPPRLPACILRRNCSKS